jgi:hypothetical protein
MKQKPKEQIYGELKSEVLKLMANGYADKTFLFLLGPGYKECDGDRHPINETKFAEVLVMEWMEAFESIVGIVTSR